MRFGIDTFSLVVVGAAFILGQIRQIPAQVRFVIMGLACGAVAIYRFQMGADGFNLAVVGIAAFFALQNFVRAARYRSPPVG
jgi:hypothetical protein